ADFSRAGRVVLDDKRGGRLLQIGHRLLLRADKLHADAALTHVGLEDERVIEPVLFAAALQRGEALGRSGPVEQVRLCRELRTCRLKIAERGDLGFADEAAKEDTWVRRC